MSLSGINNHCQKRGRKRGHDNKYQPADQSLLFSHSPIRSHSLLEIKSKITERQVLIPVITLPYQLLHHIIFFYNQTSTKCLWQTEIYVMIRLDHLPGRPSSYSNPFQLVAKEWPWCIVYISWMLLLIIYNPASLEIPPSTLYIYEMAPRILLHIADISNAYRRSSINLFGPLKTLFEH